MEVLIRGEYLNYCKDDGYEFVCQAKGNGVVEIVAVIEEKGIEHVLLTRQYRPPIGDFVIENAAGLSGDKGDEDLIQAAARECEEELGYRPGGMHLLTRGPSSAGQSNEIVTIFLATNLEKVSQGGGALDENENITVIKVPLHKVHDIFMNSDHAVSPRVWAGLSLREAFLRDNKKNGE